MTRKKQSKNQEHSLKNIPLNKLKTNLKTIKSDSKKYISNPDNLYPALWDCLIEKDLDSFKEILKAHINVVNKKQLASNAQTSRTTLYRILSKDGNPTLENIANILHALHRHNRKVA